MSSDRTFATELSTALGMLGDDDIGTALRRRPASLINLGPDDWDRLERVVSEPALAADVVAGFANGHAFLRAPDALAGRRPRIVEWTGERHPPGDEQVPTDLRIDHVYLVSCKYLSRILHNLAPARLVEGLLSTSTRSTSGDWYQRVAPAEYQALYEVCLADVDPNDSPGLWDRPALPGRVVDLTTEGRRRVSEQFSAGWSPAAADAYRSLAEAVSRETAARWRSGISDRNAEAVVWRLLRIGSAPYFILGADRKGSMRLRIDTPWDWRQRYRLVGFDVAPQPGGQPRVGWVARYEVRATGEEDEVAGHVELRWSHGRFKKPPEAKVYLDTHHGEVPGYHSL